MAGATTTYRTARFLTPDYLVRAADNALSCPLYIDGALVAPSSGTVTVYDASSVAIVTAAAVTVTASIATYTLLAASVPSTLSLGMGWRVEWSLVVSSVTTVYRNAAGLVRSQLAPVVTDADLFRRESALNPSGGAPVSSLQDFQDYIDEAWITIHSRLAGRGRLPHLIMEPHVLREPLLTLTLHLIFNDFRTRLNDTWKEKSDEYFAKYLTSWSELAFEYDEGDSGSATSRTKTAAETTIWLSSGGYR